MVLLRGMWNMGSDIYIGKISGAGALYDKEVHTPLSLPSTRRVQMGLLNLFCRANLEEVSAGAFAGRTFPLIPAHLPFLIKFCLFPCLTELSTGGCCFCRWLIP